MHIIKDLQVQEETSKIYQAIETDNYRLTDLIRDNWKKGNF